MPIPPVPPNSVFVVTFEGDFQGQQVMNSFHYIFLNDASSPHDDVMDGLQTAIGAVGGLYDDWRACIPDNVTNITQYYQRIWPVRYAKEVIIPAVRIGSRDPASMTNLAAVMTRTGDLAGRANISNIHIPGLTNEDMEGGYISAGLQGVMEVAADESVKTVELGIGLGVLSPCAYHRANPALSAVLTGAYVQDTIRVMRRRTVRQGS